MIVYWTWVDKWAAVLERMCMSDDLSHETEKETSKKSIVKHKWQNVCGSVIEEQAVH